MFSSLKMFMRVMKNIIKNIAVMNIRILNKQNILQILIIKFSNNIFCLFRKENVIIYFKKIEIK